MSEIEKILENLKTRKIKIDLTKKEIFKLSRRKKEIEKLLEIKEKSRQLILELSKESQKDTIKYIENIVSLALKSVFNDEYKFHMELTEKYNQQEIHFFIENQSGILIEPRDPAPLSGGVINVACLGLRPANWSLEEDVMPIMVFDEPFKDLKKERIPLIGSILKKLNEMLGIQFIIVTHEDNLVSIGDNIIHLKEGT